jgi:hypothetical protein
MVRHGVGVVAVVVALAGCGSSDEDKVIAALEDLNSATRLHDAERLCGEVLHPNTVRAIERMLRADAAPGEPRPSCERKYSASMLRPPDLASVDPKADDVTIKADVAYFEYEDGEQPIARRDGDTWKIDVTGDPTTAWRMHASSACVRWQDTLQAMSLPSASRRGIIDHLRGQAVALTTFRRELDADAAPGEAKTPAGDLAASLDRMGADFEGVAAALRRGRSLDAALEKAGKEVRDEVAEIFRAANAAGVRAAGASRTRPLTAPPSAARPTRCASRSSGTSRASTIRATASPRRRVTCGVRARWCGARAAASLA